MTEIYEVVKNHKGPILVEMMPYGSTSMQVKVVKSDLLQMLGFWKIGDKEFNYYKMLDSLIISQKIFS
jgi:hypothetical protein